MKRYNTPHRSRVIKTRLTEEEYAEFFERVFLCKMSQSEFIRQALTKSRIQPVITVSPVNDELLSAVGKLTAEYGKIGGNLNQIARCLNEYGASYNALSQEVRAAMNELLGGEKLPKMETLKKQRREQVDKKKALYAEYRQAQQDMRQAVAVKANIDHLLGLTDGRDNKEQTR